MNRGWVNCGAILGPNQRPTFLGQHSMRVDWLFFTVVHRTCIFLSLLTLVAHAQKPDDTGVEANPGRPDRKSTRLNSSHSQISYAVFCLKKKKKKKYDCTINT